VILTFLSLQIASLITVPAIIGYLAGAAALALFVRGLIEPYLLDIAHVQVEPGHIGPAGPLSPRPLHSAATSAASPDSASSPRLRILLLSDLHAEWLLVPEKRILAGCQALQPDVILFAGDLSESRRYLPQAVELFRKIESLPGAKACPFFIVRGNHDDDETAAALRRAGFTLLENDAAMITVRGQDWQIVGLGELVNRKLDMNLALERAKKSPVPPQRRVVLAHNPDALLRLPEGQAGLFLAGHLHGGQIWLPGNLEFYLLRRETLPRIGHIRGSFVWKGIPAYISRGLGCVLLPMRLFSKPEITFIDII
jgi:uncharacterized protein